MKQINIVHGNIGNKKAEKGNSKGHQEVCVCVCGTRESQEEVKR